MMQSAILVLPYLDASGELKVFASDVEGRWQPNVNFVPCRLTKEKDGAGIECRMMPWRKSALPRVERSIVEALNPLHLQAAKAIIKEKLTGLTVTVTEGGVILTDPTALNRERLETAKIWLSLAGQYVALKSQFDAGRIS
jgi:hypothetical protein